MLIISDYVLYRHTFFNASVGFFSVNNSISNNSCLTFVLSVFKSIPE